MNRLALWSLVATTACVGDVYEGEVFDSGSAGGSAEGSAGGSAGGSWVTDVTRRSARP